MENILDDIQQARSDYIRGLVQSPGIQSVPLAMKEQYVPKRIVQFWDNLDCLPQDVQSCLDSWAPAEDEGLERVLYDHRAAGNFIRQKLGPRHKKAYDKCYHPAMQADYFRLCYIFSEGGCYIDADDVYSGSGIKSFFADGRLKIQPLCYDSSTALMVPPQVFTQVGANNKSWIFYFNNNPMMASSGHPIIGRTLTHATICLENYLSNNLPEIQSSTGPGSLSKSVVEAVAEDKQIEKTLLVLNQWENIARSEWDLCYRKDSRNWRLSNGRVHHTDKVKPNKHL